MCTLKFTNKNPLGGGFLPPEPVVRDPVERPVEFSMSPCANNQSHFQCIHREKECIPRYLICDGEFDCTDGSDEYSCDTQTRAKRGTDMGSLFRTLIILREESGLGCPCL